MGSLMVAHFRPIRKETVMCSVAGCLRVAAFVFTGDSECAAGERSVVAAYCDHHAQEAAKGLGHQWPISERQP